VPLQAGLPDPLTLPLPGSLSGSAALPIANQTMIRPVLFLLPYVAIIGLCGLSAWQAGTSLRERAECRAVALLAASEGQSGHRCP
jgi:hypothetical protein